jgi:putative nucleotidyltransferase with HDIG domain
MTVDPAIALPPPPPRCDQQQVINRLKGCPRLPSLSSVNSALRELLNADQRYTSQVAEIIRRDPSLTARLLRLVNSVYYGLSTPINSIEEAVFYLGIRQIRQLAMVTPILEDFQKLVGKTQFAWREFWQHCIGTAILTREVVSALQSTTDEVDYVAGLVHDVGKIVMASAFPDHFAAVHARHRATDERLIDLEREILGIDHADLGALYLRSHSLPEVLVETAQFHHQPAGSGRYPQVVAAVQIADLLVRHAKIGESGDHTEVTSQDWLNAPGWDILFAHHAETEKSLARANLHRSLERLPTILEGLV